MARTYKANDVISLKDRITVRPNDFSDICTDDWNAKESLIVPTCVTSGLIDTAWVLWLVAGITSPQPLNHSQKSGWGPDISRNLSQISKISLDYKSTPASPSLSFWISAIHSSLYWLIRKLSSRTVSSSSYVLAFVFWCSIPYNAVRFEAQFQD